MSGSFLLKCTAEFLLDACIGDTFADERTTNDGPGSGPKGSGNTGPDDRPDQRSPAPLSLSRSLTPRPLGSCSPGVTGASS